MSTKRKASLGCNVLQAVTYREVDQAGTAYPQFNRELESESASALGSCLYYASLCWPSPMWCYHTWPAKTLCYHTSPAKALCYHTWPAQALCYHTCAAPKSACHAFSSLVSDYNMPSDVPRFGDEGCYEVMLWESVLLRLVRGYAALENEQAVRRYATKAAALRMAETGEDGGWLAVAENPRKTEAWAGRGEKRKV